MSDSLCFVCYLAYITNNIKVFVFFFLQHVRGRNHELREHIICVFTTTQCSREQYNKRERNAI